MSHAITLYGRLIQNVVDYAIFMLDNEGTIISWNPGAERIKGYSTAEIVGRNFTCFYTPEDRGAGIPQQALKTARTTGRFSTEGWLVRKDGTRFWAGVVIDAIHDDEGALIGFAKITRDLTERREAQLALDASRDQLAQSLKMEAVGQLAGGLAHDFNNLLTGISGSLELIRARLAQGRVAGLDRYVVSAQGASARAAGLTHRLLAFARRQALNPKATNVNRLVASMEDMLQRTVGPAIKVETLLSASLWPTLCDVNQLETAILNLCINARDAMPNGGLMTIETANAWIDDEGARERNVPLGQYTMICVADTGTGMPPEVISRAFDPFFTTKPTGQSSGLGLSMVYGFATQSGGQVRLDSEVGTGTTVRLYLPRHLGEAPAEEAPRQTGPTPRAGVGEAVLVVDDEPSIRMLITEILDDLGYAAIEAADSISGLKVLSSDVRIDLLITDVGLPGGMNGRQMAETARAKRPGLKVLLISGYTGNTAIGNGHLLPGMHLITKPFPMDSLALRIQSIIKEV